MAGHKIDELLIKINIDSAQANKINMVIDQLIQLGNQAAKVGNKLKSSISDSGQLAQKIMDKIGQQVNKVKSQFNKLKPVISKISSEAVSLGKKIINAFNSKEYLENIENLSKENGLLFDISEQDVQLLKECQSTIKKVENNIDSISARLMSNLAPSIIKIVDEFNNWLDINKDLIAEGLSVLTKVFSWLIQLVLNGGRAINKLVSNTIGWKVATLALAAAFAVLKQKFLLSPIGLISAAIVGILLLIDDLMVYLDGGQSAFGGFWGACISWIKKALDWWNKLGDNWKSVIYAVLGYIGLLIGTKGISSIATKALSMSKTVASAFGFIGKAMKALTAVMIANPILAIVTAIALAAYLIYDNWDYLKEFFSNFWDSVTNLFKNGIKKILMFFGMSESGAQKTVDKIGRVFGLVVDLITAPFRNAWNLVKGLFAIWTDDTTSFTDKLGKTFDAVVNFITQPFKDAWQFVKDYLNLWGVDIDGFTKNVKKTFSKVTDFITKPFKDAKKWIEDNFTGYIDKVKSGFKSVGSLFGLGGDDVEPVKTMSSAAMPAVSPSIYKPDNSNVNNSNSNISMIVNQSIVAPDPVTAGGFATDGVSKAVNQVNMLNKGLGGN